MATTLRSYIFITFVVCCVSFAILVTSISTTSWVSGRISSQSGEENYDINYGLFLGTLANLFFWTPKYFPIHLACIPEENVCVWSCKPTAEERQEDVYNLYYAVEDAKSGCGSLSVISWSQMVLGRMREEWDLSTMASRVSTTEKSTMASPVSTTETSTIASPVSTTETSTIASPVSTTEMSTLANT